MPTTSAGLLPFRVRRGQVELFLVHPGGPFWARKDDAAWSVAKGEHGPGEDPTDAARREFREEVGVAPPAGALLDLGTIVQAGGKRVRIWAVEAPGFEVDRVESNEFEMEWPPRSGRRQTFPEVDRAEWMSEADARRRLVRGQVTAVDRLLEEVAGGGPAEGSGP